MRTGIFDHCFIVLFSGVATVDDVGRFSFVTQNVSLKTQVADEVALVPEGRHLSFYPIYKPVLVCCRTTAVNGASLYNHVFVLTILVLQLMSV